MKKYILTIELVPSTSWFNNVRAVVSQKQWDILRKIVYDKAKNICEICGGTGSKHPVECHEIWEYDDDKCIRKLIGMISLCPDCHQVKHIGLSQIKGLGEVARNHLAKINKISVSDANDYIKNSFKIWEKRSQKEWELDISHLSEYGIDIKKVSKKKANAKQQ